MGDLVSDNYKTGQSLQQEVAPRVKKPPMYAVIIMNDDFTPMDFVIEVLRAFFSMTNMRAKQVMLEVHFKGQGVCGIYTRDVAETKVAQVINYARNHGYPLLCVMEPT